MHADPAFSGTSLHSYINKLNIEADQVTATIPEHTVMNLKVKIDLPNGNYILNSFELIPNVKMHDALVQIFEKTAIISFENTNNFPAVIFESKLFKLNCINADAFHIFSIQQNTSESRIEHLIPKLNLSHCNDQEKQKIIALVEEYNDCFFVVGDKTKHTDVLTHSIKLKPGARPAFTRQYRIPETQKQELQNQLQQMENEGIIEKCKASGWNSPVILVPKSDENGNKTKFRLVIDYRRLNDATEPISHPIPNVHSINDSLAGSAWYTGMDFKGAFYQIMLDEASRNFTCFENNRYSYRFISMRQGLHTSPAVMQVVVTRIFGDLANVIIYFDDFLLFTKTLDEHFELLKEVFNRIRKHSFKLNIEKCDFLVCRIKFLGFVFDKNGCSPNPNKVSCIENYPVPTTVPELQRFLGLC